MNKTINRDHQTTNKIFDNRSIQVDYVTLIPILKKGLRVLDVGCGTGDQMELQNLLAQQAV